MTLRHLALLPVVLAFAGCAAFGHQTHTRTYSWPDGKRMAQETYYNDHNAKASPYDPANVLDGPCTYWNSRGTVVAEGTWKDGKPYSGICWIPGSANARSAHLGHFEKFAEGKSLGPVPTAQ